MTGMPAQASLVPRVPDTDEGPRYRKLRQRLEEGLPLSPRPYAALGRACGLTEQQVMMAVRRWQQEGLIKRLGLVVRHRSLGYRANAMVVWDVADDQVAELGRRLAREACVTLCYQRPRRLPDWRYNLFCMIHGTDREQVRRQLQTLIERHHLERTAHAVLFSHKAYRQCGGRYVDSDR
ncbi:AsnC family protein [Marinobacteraceae bacterium S3BR75-40.1]